eukprot:scaffold28898_cov37-Prasinocladus_malaysianus.AAC.1
MPLPSASTDCPEDRSTTSCLPIKSCGDSVYDKLVSVSCSGAQASGPHWRPVIHSTTNLKYAISLGHYSCLPSISDSALATDDSAGANEI